MLTSQMIKDFARNELHVDTIGIGSIERFRGAPPDMSPFNLMPQAKSVIAFSQRIIRGTYRGIDEGTHWPSYQVFGYSGLNGIIGKTVYRIGRFVENHGYEAMGVPTSAALREFGPRGPNFKPGMPPREITLNIRIAATLCGIGEIGWSKVFLTPEFGPRQRFALLLTDAELEPDPIYEGKICDRCKLCCKHCGGQAISATESVKITIAGHEVEWGKLNELACESGIHGGCHGEYSPFEQEYPRKYGYGRAIEGAVGCIRACMIHLEEKDRLKNKFKNRFRTRPLWKPVDHSQPVELPADVLETYGEHIEDYNAYLKYQAESNYGTAAKEEKPNPLID